MKKNLLFGLLWVLVAWFWFGGVSMAATIDCMTWDPEIENPDVVAKIWNDQCYASLYECYFRCSTGTESATTIEVLKSHEWTWLFIWKTSSIAAENSEAKNIMINFNDNTYSC